MTWLNNAWFIGITTGIVSGLLVTWIARLVLSKKDDREYQQKLAAANREIIYSIRAGIPEGQIASNEVILALIHSSARRAGVASEDLYRPKEIGEELIKEVMDSSFLSAGKKAEYCSQLNLVGTRPLQPPGPPTDLRIEIMEVGKSKELAEYRRRVTSMVGALLGVIAGMMSAVIALKRFKPTPAFTHEMSTWIIAVIIPVFFAIIVLIAYSIVRGEFWEKQRMSAFEAGRDAELARNRAARQERDKLIPKVKGTGDLSP